MARLIDADKFIEYLGLDAENSREENLGEIVTLEDFDRQPTVDAEPVRRGKWEWFEERNGNPFDGYDEAWGYRCSCCKSELPDTYDDPDVKPDLAYCPNCGAKMEESENE